MRTTLPHKPKSHRAHLRCRKCRKIRRMRMPANWMLRDRIMPAKREGLGRICWICVIREIDPAWRPGKPLPEGVNLKEGLRSIGPNNYRTSRENHGLG